MGRDLPNNSLEGSRTKDFQCHIRCSLYSISSCLLVLRRPKCFKVSWPDGRHRVCVHWKLWPQPHPHQIKILQVCFSSPAIVLLFRNSVPVKLSDMASPVLFVFNLQEIVTYSHLLDLHGSPIPTSLGPPFLPPPTIVASQSGDEVWQWRVCPLLTGCLLCTHVRRTQTLGLWEPQATWETNRKETWMRVPLLFPENLYIFLFFGKPASLTLFINV